MVSNDAVHLPGLGKVTFTSSSECLALQGTECTVPFVLLLGPSNEDTVALSLGI